MWRFAVSVLLLLVAAFFVFGAGASGIVSGAEGSPAPVTTEAEASPPPERGIYLEDDSISGGVVIAGPDAADGRRVVALPDATYCLTTVVRMLLPEGVTLEEFVPAETMAEAVPLAGQCQRVLSRWVTDETVTVPLAYLPLMEEQVRLHDHIIGLEDGNAALLAANEQLEANIGSMEGRIRSLEGEVDRLTPEPTPEPTSEPTLGPCPTLAPDQSPAPHESGAPMPVPCYTPEPMAETAVTGAVLLPEGSTLDGAAEWSVELQDTSLADAPAVVIAADGDVLTDATSTEIPFEIVYDPDDIVETNTYTLSARVVDMDGNLLFINDTSIPVLTRDAPSGDVEIPVIQVAGFSPMAVSVPVPDIVDIPEADAITALDDAGLAPGGRTEANDETIVSGNIISSGSVAASEVAPGSEVAYVVSVGPEAVAVPDLVDIPEADAITALDDAGLVPGGRTEANDETIVSGNIISSDPVAASEVAPGSEVAYVVSVGPEAVAVPDLSGAAADAEDALAAAGLVGSASEAFSDSVAAGDVVSQDPGAGTEVAVTSTVSYVISLGVEQVEVPDLSGAAADADTTLAAAGLAGSASEAFSDSVAAGDVISQDPSAGASVDIGSTVSYVISVGTEQVEVRVIELEADAALRFMQDGEQIRDIPVTPGETVLFRIDNTAGFDHSFYIGRNRQLRKPAGSTRVGIAPWSSGVQELEWVVPDDISKLKFGCTVPGHYTIMQGTFSITE